MAFLSNGLLYQMWLLDDFIFVYVNHLIGNTKANSSQLLAAMLFFALGAAMSPLAFLFAYLTQLNYGNAVSNGADKRFAVRFHKITYLFVGLGLLLFVLGIVIAVLGLANFQFSKS